MKSGESGRVVRVVVFGAVVLAVGAGFVRDTGTVQAQRSQDPARQRVQDPTAVTVKDQTTSPASTRPGSTPMDGMPNMGPNRAGMDEERQRAIDDDRRKKLAADVNKLLTLSNELKSEIDKANKDQLSLGAMRKAAEIEKLAKSIQSQMKS